MIKEEIRKNVFNARGWRTSRKIIVIESDDWGSVRTSSKKNLDFLKSKGIPVNRCHYMLNDSLASEEDLSSLYEVLTGVVDVNSNHPVLTANCLVANPDFEKIRSSDFENYHWESITTSLKRYPRHSKSFAMWSEGLNQKIFFPQLHGREHLNVSRWMKDLQTGNEEAILAFNMNMFGLSGHLAKKKRGSYLAAFDGGRKELTYDRSEILREAIRMFQNLFDFSTKSFIAPNYVWDDSIENILSENSVKYIQGRWNQLVSVDFGEKREIKRHYLGERNSDNQIYLTRNGYFEPSENMDKDWVDSCLHDIQVAFRWKKPAIISSHRVNFIGYLNPRNRDLNLKKLDDLLKRIVKKWPDVEFMTSVDLGRYIESNEN